MNDSTLRKMISKILREFIQQDKLIEDNLVDTKSIDEESEVIDEIEVVDETQNAAN